MLYVYTIYFIWNCENKMKVKEEKRKVMGSK